MASPTRRRPRGPRVTVAVLLLLTAFAIVSASAIIAVALTTGSLLITICAAVVSVLLGIVATRLTYNEVAEERFVSAQDRAQQARSFQQVLDRHDEDHRQELATLSGRIVERDDAVAQLEVAVVESQHRAACAHRDLRRETSRADAAEARVRTLNERVAGLAGELTAAQVKSSELEQELEILEAQFQHDQTSTSRHARWRA